VKWKAIKQGIHTAAEEVLGTTRFDRSCQAASDKKNEARKEMLQRGRSKTALEKQMQEKKPKTYATERKYNMRKILVSVKNFKIYFGDMM
jgi:hypothetical protein